MVIVLGLFLMNKGQRLSKPPCFIVLFRPQNATPLKFRRVTIRGAQPSARLSEEICLSEGSAGVSPRALRAFAGFCGGPRDFPRFFGGSDPMLVTLGNSQSHPPN